MTFHNRIFVIFVFDEISKGMIVIIEKEPREYFQWLHFWNQWVLLIKMHCWVLYLLDFDLKIRSGQVCKQCATIKLGIGANWAMSIRNFLRINPLQHNFLSCHFETSQSHLVKLFVKGNLVYLDFMVNSGSFGKQFLA